MLTHSANLRQQSRGLDRPWPRRGAGSPTWPARLARGRTRRDRAAVQAEIAAICKPRWVAATVRTMRHPPSPVWRTDARARLEARLFGKRILFTNRDWPVPT